MVRSLFAALPVLAIVFATIHGCGSDGAPASPGLGTVPGPADSCLDGQTRECHHTIAQRQNVVHCYVGKQTCSGGVWGACGDGTITARSLTSKSGKTSGGLSPAAVGNLPSPTGIPCRAGGAAPSGGTCGAADPAVSYSAINGGWKAIREGNPTIAGSCSTGTSDGCGHNSRCIGGAGCQFYGSGQTSAVCTATQWDLTFPTPCLASSPMMQICNRGNGPTPTSGTYSGVVSATSLQGRATDVSLCKSSPATTRGYCSINFATTSIAPGTCINVPTSTLCPGVVFDSSGVSGGDRTTIQWNMPDWPDPNCGNRARIPGECQEKNNFTVMELSRLTACTGTGCGGASGGTFGDPCNPACNGYNEVPVLPITATNPVPGVFLKSTGLSTCPGAPNFTTAPCGGDPYKLCQQDFHCDVPGTGNCLWNVPTSYKDPACPGVDLTLGAPCYDSLTDTSHHPVCNRGNTDLTAGVVTLQIENGPTPWDCRVDPILTSPVIGSHNASTTPIPAGSCVDVPTPGVTTGNRTEIVNGGKTITECGLGFGTPGGGGCVNNNAPAKQNGGGPPGTCAACGGVPGLATVYNAPPYRATCAPGEHPYWDLFMWNIAPPLVGTWNIRFEMRTAPDVAGVPGTWTPFISVAQPPLGGNPAVRDMTNPLDLYAALGNLPNAGNEHLELRITVTSQFALGPILNSWQLTYSCLSAE